jgi:hypothetical protein
MKKPRKSVPDGAKNLALGPRTSRSAKPASAEELHSIATRMVNASTAAEAEKLKQRYLARFYGKAQPLRTRRK